MSSKNSPAFANTGQMSLAEELGAAAAAAAAAASNSSPGRHHLMLRKSHTRLRHEDSSPDSERMATDSGHSTAHSPDNGPKSVSPIPCSTLQNIDSVSPDSTPGKIKENFVFKKSLTQSLGENLFHSSNFF